MARPSATSEDLAVIVSRKLNSTRLPYKAPSLDILKQLFRVLFYASLKTEEGQLIKLSVSFMDPERAEPDPVENEVSKKWSSIAFDRALSLDTKTLVKLAKAADPWSSSLAVYYDQNEQLQIWGMIDQAIHYQSFLNYEGDLELKQPGLFQASITGIGSLTVMFNYELLATLKQDVLISKYVDIFQYGVVSRMLEEYIDPMTRKIVGLVNNHYPSMMIGYWEIRLNKLWIEILSRILLRIQYYGHGGALLLSVDKSADIKRKYKIKYGRIENAVQALMEEVMDHNHLDDEIFLDQKSDQDMPKSLHTKFNRGLEKIKSIEDEIKGAVRYVASLSCVDGLILATPLLNVIGFGGVIEDVGDQPSVVHISRTAKIDEQTKLVKQNSDHFGTRHRSMFRYCWNHPGSLGFVISQDGDIRAITKHDNKLIMWENIKVQQLLKSRLVKKPTLTV